jgi:hypothetical protein
LSLPSFISKYGLISLEDETPRGGFDESDNSDDSDVYAPERIKSTISMKKNPEDLAIKTRSPAVSDDFHPTPNDDEPQPENKPELGLVKGVILRCLFNIFGVIMFLRLPYMYGVTGALFASLIILICKSITMITALSLSAIVTNGIVIICVLKSCHRLGNCRKSPTDRGGRGIL